MEQHALLLIESSATGLVENVPVVSVLSRWLSVVLWFVVEMPLVHLYLRGPQLPFVGGFCQGADPADICMQLSLVPSQHWKQNPDACALLIYRRIQSFLILTYTVLYFGLLLLFVKSFFTRRWFCTTRRASPPPPAHARPLCSALACG